MKRQTHMTLQRAENILRIFGLRKLPRYMPYDAPKGQVGLVLPEILTAREIRQIAVAAALPLVANSAWYIGDLLNWLKAHPEAPISREEIVAKFVTVSRYSPQTLYNYESICRAFVLRERRPNLTINHHDVLRARAIPARVKSQLLNLAEAKKLSPTELRYQRDIWYRRNRGASEVNALRDEIYALAVEIRRAAANVEPAAHAELVENLRAFQALANRYLNRREGAN
jgi:hypothetical protein